MMDFGAVGLEGLVVAENNNGNGAVSDPEAGNPKSNGSGFLKQARSGSGDEEWRCSKLVKTEDSEKPKTMLQLQGTPLLLRSNSLLSGEKAQQQSMLSFSTSGSEVAFLSKNGGLAERSSQNPTFYYSQQSPCAYTRNAGYGSGGLNAGVQGPSLGARGPFTPSQWVELEHQALIYKYLISNMPVPSNLLIALKKSLNPYGLSGLASGSYAHNSLGWGSFHLGFSGNTDPEPGRCRRTDGKKWRCSRDAVADQKYCERHINRGRHRSRKPVEGRTGQAVSGSAAKAAPLIGGGATPASVMSSGSGTNSLGITHHQIKGTENPSADMLANRMQVSPTTSLKSKDPPFAIPKQHIPMEESTHSEFGLVSSDSLLYPSEKSSCLNSRNYNTFMDFTEHENSDPHPLRHFIDDWPKDQSNRSTWPEELKSDWTQLSMSIPVTSSDFSSTSSSSPKEKIALSPLRLSREMDPVPMGLAMNNELNGLTQKQANWIPISWGSSMGGPLAEVLNSTSGSTGACKNGSPQFGSSPTGVLQRTPFVSLSNSSSGSSPRGDNRKANENGVLGDELLGSTLASSFPIPSLYPA